MEISDFMKNRGGRAGRGLKNVKCDWGEHFRKVVSCIVNIDHMRLINIIEGGGLRIHYAMQHNTQYTLHRSISTLGLTSAPPLQCTVGDIHQNMGNNKVSLQLVFFFAGFP